MLKDEGREVEEGRGTGRWRKGGEEERWRNKDVFFRFTCCGEEAAVKWKIVRVALRRGWRGGVETKGSVEWGGVAEGSEEVETGGEKE